MKTLNLNIYKKVFGLVLSLSFGGTAYAQNCKSLEADFTVDFKLNPVFTQKVVVSASKIDDQITTDAVLVDHRLAATQVLRSVVNNMSSGVLPIIAENTENGKILNKALQLCEQGTSCEEFDALVYSLISANLNVSVFDSTRCLLVDGQRGFSCSDVSKNSLAANVVRLTGSFKALDSVADSEAFKRSAQAYFNVLWRNGSVYKSVAPFSSIFFKKEKAETVGFTSATLQIRSCKQAVETSVGQQSPVPPARGQQKPAKSQQTTPSPKPQLPNRSQAQKTQVPGQAGLDLSPVRITNRAQCAVDSDSPTRSAFLILDGYNAGKLAYGLARNVGGDADVFAKEGMKEFRLSVTKLTLEIMERIRTGRLPLLPMDFDKTKLKAYPSIVKKCGNKTYCDDLNQYLTYTWAMSEYTQYAGKSQAPEWQKLDTFVDRNFTTTVVGSKSCAYLKRFSPLQANLHSADLNAAVLADMAQAYLNKKDYIASCTDEVADLDSRNAAIQIDLTINDPDSWEAKGFDYWNSVKIYLSWAWRNSKSLEKYSPKYAQLFRSLALEESIMFLPNGCRSITKPACDSESLSLNSLRELAKPNTPSPEHMKEVPGRIENNLLERGDRAVNNDFLGTRSYDTASQWVENFRKQFIQNRGSAKNKFQSAIQFMNILADSMTAQELVEFTKPLMLGKIQNNNHLDELYYFCTEARLAGDKRLDFLRSDVDRISQLTAMLKAAEFSPREIGEIVAYFNSYVDAVLPICDSLEKKNLWNPSSYTVNKAGFQNWAKELLNISFVDENGKFVPPSTFTYGAPLLVWKQEAGLGEGNVICQSSLDCGRKVIKSLVDLHAVSVYADAFLPVSPTAASPGVFNPYSELKACKIYDPWYQTKRAQRVFMSDLANTVLFGWNALPIYLDIDYPKNKVVSFNQLVKNGKIKFDPNIQASKMQTALVADFGAMLGAPCAVSIAPTSLNAPTVYAFDGISVNYCKQKQTDDAVVNKPNDIVPGDTKSKSYCGGCSMNFVSIASVEAAPTGFNPLKAGIFLFRSIYRFVTGMKDPVNVPKFYTVDLAKVAETYKRYGSIPEHCVAQLGKGLKCFESVCAAKAAAHFEAVTGGVVTDVQAGDRGNGSPSSKTAWIKSNICSGQVIMPFNCTEDSDYFAASRQSNWGAQGQCKEKF